MAQLRDRQIVDAVGKRLFSSQPRGPLDLCQDLTEMPHHDQVAAPMLRNQRIDGAIDTGANLVPALAAGGAHIAGGLPVGADMVGGFGVNLGPAAQLPGAKVDLAQAAMIRQPLAGSAMAEAVSRARDRSEDTTTASCGR